MSTAKPIPPGMHTVTPHLVCAGAANAIDFYKKAFNAEEMNRLEGANGMIMNAMIRIGDSPLMLVDENKDWGLMGPKMLKGASVTIHLYVENVDAAYQRAVDAGATVKMAPADMFWGDRYGVLEDPFGHQWSIATHIRDLTQEEIAKAMVAAMPCSNPP